MQCYLQVGEMEIYFIQHLPIDFTGFSLDNNSPQTIVKYWYFPLTKTALSYLTLEVYTTVRVLVLIMGVGVGVIIFNVHIFSPTLSL